MPSDRIDRGGRTGAPTSARGREAEERAVRRYLEALDRDDRSALVDLERSFVERASAYSLRNGLSYAAWRQVGVPVATLRRAGITPTRRSRRPAGRRPT